MSLIRTNDGFRTRSLTPRSIFSDDFFTRTTPMRNWMEEEETTQYVPAANISENEKRFLVELSIPGYAKDDVRIEIDNNNMLRVTGAHEETTKDETKTYTRREFRQGSFERTFQLSEAINENEITARYFDGVLSIELPKKESGMSKSTTKVIDIS